MSDADKKLDRPVWVRCSNCCHRWVAAYLPMAVSEFVEVCGGLHCPRCATGTRGIFIAQDVDISTAD